MRINDDHMYHGAALTQIAEYPGFKAINTFELKESEKSSSAFTINQNTGVYLKYSSKPTKGFKEYVFTFTQAHFDELKSLRDHYAVRVFIVLVCIKAKEICVLTLDELEAHRQGREDAFGGPEPQYQLLVTVPPNKSFRVYMNTPGKKGRSLKQQIVSRNSFPRAIFQ
ncbi:MAG: hypothetical protein LAO04_03670 [Acidobacteriia bacterium]|nr:hypothetical protein [Terriglobia bacterium]